MAIPIDPPLYIESEGIKLRYMDKGGGIKVILLIHSFNMDTRAWAIVIYQLVKEGYRVVAFDLRGHGESDKPTDPRSYDMIHMHVDITNIIEKVCKVKPVLMGFSNLILSYRDVNPDKIRHTIDLSLSALKDGSLTNDQIAQIRSIIRP